MRKCTALLITALCLLIPLTTRAAERNTLIFISDLHMNVDVPYAWLKTNAPALASFINRVNAREDVAQLVILGDLLDDWVETVENAPHTFQDILTSSNNAEVVTALRTICQNPNITVTYVVGNHDMLAFDPANKAVITNLLPGMKIVADPPGLGSFSMNSVIWGEHGHRYCMFNAPDIWSRTPGHLPLGYFISRIAASKSARDHTVYTTMDALDMFVKSSGSYYTPPAGQENVVFNDEFIHVLFDTFALVWGGYLPWNTFMMGGLDYFNTDPSMDDIGNVYNGIYSNWPSRMDIVNPYEAVWNDVGHLSSAANLLFEMPDRIKPLYPFIPRIVLFGHTHKAAFNYYCDTVNSVYANTGTWIDGSPRTWVEIETNHGGNKDFYTVSLWFDGESVPRQSATLDALISSVPPTPIALVIKANGSTNDISITSSDNLSIAVQLYPGEYSGVEVDWWVVALAGSTWYYLDSAAGWMQFDGNFSICHPVNQGTLFNLPETPVLNMTGLPVGSYTFWFAVDYPMDGILNVDGQILLDSVKVVVQ